MSSDDLAYLTAEELIARYRDKSLSPVEATEAALDRIERHNGPVNAFVLTDPEGALAAARASEARWARGEPQGLVDGVPSTVKDLVWAKGWPMRAGSLTTSDAPCDADSPIVARLREHGAVFLGKTTTPEFGWKGVTDSPFSGITRNPWDTSVTPGGSSGGAVVAAALGMGALHTGGDGGGSIRIPASFTGVFGIKPSYGRVPRYPTGSHGTLSHAGPIARTVTDAALMLNVISGPDTRDWFSLPYDHRDWRVGLDDGVAGLRIAFSPALGFATVDPEVSALVEAAAKLFESLGAHVERADPGIEDPIDVFIPHWYGGTAHSVRNFTKTQLDQLDPGLREIAELGKGVTLTDYLTAVEGRIALGVHMKKFHENHDLLLTPTMPIPAFEAGRELPPGSTADRWMSWSPFTYPFNLTQQPAASVPCGFTRAGLPVGLQIIGDMYADATVLRACRAFERERPFEMPRAPKVTHKT